METLLMILMFLTAVFLILLVLIQRGRGGGLAGALGGMGGQSAFGTKAGDVFTRVTMVSAAIWIILCMLTVKWIARKDNPFAGFQGKATAPASPLSNTEADSPNGAAGTSSDTPASDADTPQVEKPDAEAPNTEAPSTEAPDAADSPAAAPSDPPATGAAAETDE